MKLREKFGRLSYLWLFSMTGLVVFGTLFVYSVCSLRADPSLRLMYVNHALMGFIGIPLALALAFIPFRCMLAFRWVIYGAVLMLLLMTPFLGTEAMGAKRWIFGIQPSELAKLAIIMVLAHLYGARTAGRGVGAFLLTGLIVGAPLALVMMQPDLGTALVMVPTVFAMLFVSNVAPRLTWCCFLAVVLSASFIIGAVWYAERPDTPPEKRELAIRMTGLRPHQVTRLQVFLFPERDIHGSGYNRRQSEIAVGSGGVWGKGYLRGEQYSLGYLPPSIATNDFVFSVLAEEAGFAGSMAVLLLFLGLFASGLGIAFNCRDDVGRVFCVGATTLIFSHMFINIAMTIGLMPITGLPLPFVSYGRTFLMTLIVISGLMQSVSVHGQEPVERF